MASEKTQHFKSTSELDLRQPTRIESRYSWLENSRMFEDHIKYHITDHHVKR